MILSWDVLPLTCNLRLKSCIHVPFQAPMHLAMGRNAFSLPTDIGWEVSTLCVTWHKIKTYVDNRWSNLLYYRSRSCPAGTHQTLPWHAIVPKQSKTCTGSLLMGQQKTMEQDPNAWDTQVKLLDSDFSPAHHWRLWPSVEWNNRQKSSVSPPYLHFWQHLQINKPKRRKYTDIDE